MQLQQAWLRRGALARLLWPLSQVYAVITAVRRGLYRLRIFKTEKVDVPVVVVGNVVAGGAGKTPVVIAVVQHLQARGLKVGVVSRGYGRHTDDCREVLDDSSPREVGDEPALIRRLTGVPVFVAVRRAEASRAMVARHPGTQVIVSDDGMQHLAMARDIEICVFDDRGIGNGWLLPAGPLRERWPRACDLTLHTGERSAFAGYRSQRALADDVVHCDGTRSPFGKLVGPPVDAVAAIANPESFFAMLRTRGVKLASSHALPDHYDFDSWSRPPHKGYSLVCTEKDAAKLWRSTPEALAVPLIFTPEPAFFAALDAGLAKLSSADGHQAA